MLAEGPRTYLTPELLGAIQDLRRERTAGYSSIGGEQKVKIPVGPMIVDKWGEPIQMKLVASQHPFNSYLNENAIYSEQGIMDLLNNAPQRQASISFGWEGGNGVFDYRQDPLIRKQAEGFNYAGELSNALVEAANRLGLEPGDLLSNSPLIERVNDYRRPIAYMSRGGFGPLTSFGNQLAYLSESGKGVPALLSSPDKGFMDYMKWKENPQIKGAPKKSIQKSISELHRRPYDIFDDYDYPGDTFVRSGTAPTTKEEELRDVLSNINSANEGWAFATGSEREQEIRRVVHALSREDPKALETLLALHHYSPAISQGEKINTWGVHSNLMAAREASAIIQNVLDGNIERERGARMLRSMRHDWEDTTPF